MKRGLLGAVVALAVVLAAAPIVAAFVFASFYTSETINAEISKAYPQGAQMGFRAEVQSFERGLFRSRATVAFGFVDPDSQATHIDDPIALFEQEFSHYWSFAGEFPFVWLLSSNDTLRTTQQLSAEFDGVYLTGTAKYLPFVANQGHYETPSFAGILPPGTVFEPITIDATQNELNDQINIDLRWNHFSMQTGYDRTMIEGVRLYGYGTFPQRLDRPANYRVEIGKLSTTMGEGIAINNLRLETGNTPHKQLVDSALQINADEIAFDQLTLKKPSLVSQIVGQDIKTLERITELTSGINASRNPLGVMQDLMVEIIALFDQGAVFGMSINLPFDDKPLILTASATSNKNASFDPNNLETWLNKFYIDANLTIDPDLLSDDYDLGFDNYKESLLILQEEGVTREKDGLLFINLHCEGSECLVNDELLETLLGIL
ncbi:hypothetical protein AGMMS50229_00630 [Campylobacterota bacterium]|nr:hypothetical protein AGMMS50229_00630 [Campylobacterota bacterium]